MICTSLGVIFQRCSIMSSTECDTAPMRVTPTLLPFRSAGVFISGLVMSRCNPLLTTLATITVSPPRNEAATKTSPAEFTICTSFAMSALMPAVPPWPVTITSASIPCLRNSPFCSATQTAACSPLTELKPIRTLSWPMTLGTLTIAPKKITKYAACVICFIDSPNSFSHPL